MKWAVSKQFFRRPRIGADVFQPEKLTTTVRDSQKHGTKHMHLHSVLVLVFRNEHIAWCVPWN